MSVSSSRCEPMPVSIKYLGLQAYEQVWQQMRDFTDTRDADTPDEIWIVEHPPVYTQGQAGKPEHLIAPGEIPVVQTDRGGQVTYHGPGQLVVYPLVNLKRLKLGVRALVTAIEEAVVAFLAEFNIDAAPKADAPGVYVSGDKIASLGLRVRKGCSFHGVAVNIAMDLSPFLKINPCGYVRLKMIQLTDFPDEKAHNATVDSVAPLFIDKLVAKLGLTSTDA